MNQQKRPNLIVGITGVCGGMGLELLKGFANKNYFVLGIDNNKKKIKELEKEYHKEFKGYSCDLTQSNKYELILQEIKDEFQTPDIWINNAGIAPIKTFMEHKKQEYKDVMNINFHPIEQATRFWLPEMERNQAGKIVNIASVAGLVSSPMLSSYCASKFATVGFTKSLQKELQIKQSNVNLILVCPGFIDTKMINLGSHRGLPEELKHIIADANKSANKIIKGILKGSDYIDPTFNGKFFTTIDRYAPSLMKQIQVIITPEKWKEVLKKK